MVRSPSRCRTVARSLLFDPGASTVFCVAQLLRRRLVMARAWTTPATMNAAGQRPRTNAAD